MATKKRLSYAGGGIKLFLKDEYEDQAFDRFEEEHGPEIDGIIDKGLDAAKAVIEKELRAAGLGNRFEIETEV